MQNNDVFDIRLSRIPLFLLLCFSSFIVAAGLDIGFIHAVIPPFDIAPDKKLYFWLFEFFFVVIGGVIAVQMLVYLVSPPVMFRASSEGIGFGTGFRYNLFTIPWKYVDSIGGGIDLVQAVANRKLFGGIQVIFKNSQEIPMWKATSIGVSYMNYVLTLSVVYTGPGTSGALEKLKEMKKRFT